jgi:uncharacterized protein involved in exopolysaccharide biosynthesis
MTRAIGPLSVAGGSELQTQTEPAIPVQFSPLGGGDWDEDRASRARRRRLRWQCAGGAAIAMAGAAFVLVLASRVYEARSSVLVRPPNSNGTVPQAIDGALQSEVEILQSSEVLRQAIERVGVDVLYPGLEGESTGATIAAATGRVREALAVRTLPGSDVIEVTFRHPNAETAAETVKRLVERYQQSRRETLAPVASERFLQERIEAQRAALADAESALAAFHAEHPGLASKDPRQALADQRVTIENELRTLRDASDAARSAGNSEDPSVGRARTRLDELELELQKTLNTHVEGSRVVSAVRHQIGLVRGYLASKERAATQEQGRRLELLGKRQLELEARLAELDQGERVLPELERKGRELARERDVVARRLDAYQRELEAATLAADVDEHKVAVSVRILERAHAPTAAIIPEGRARVAWALVGAALLALLGAFVMDWLEERRTQRQPMVWTAHVGTGGEGGSVALLMPHQRQGPGGGPVVLLLSGAGEGNGGKAAPGAGTSAAS